MNKVSKWLLEIEKVLPKPFTKIREEKRSNSSACIGYGLAKERFVIHSGWENFWVCLPDNQYTSNLEEGSKGRCFSMPEYLKKN